MTLFSESGILSVKTGGIQDGKGKSNDILSCYPEKSIESKKVCDKKSKSFNRWPG